MFHEPSSIRGANAHHQPEFLCESIPRDAVGWRWHFEQCLLLPISGEWPLCPGRVWGIADDKEDLANRLIANRADDGLLSHCERAGTSYLAGVNRNAKMRMPTPLFRFPGVLNSQELLVAEAIQARALASLSAQGDINGAGLEAAKAKLGAIVLRLMLDRTRSIDDLSAQAIEAFRAD